MTLLRRRLILLPHLDRLIRLSTDEPQPGPIERRTHNPRLGIQTARLRRRIQTLKPMARLPVPEADTAIIAAGEEDVVFIDGEGVDDGVVAVEVLHKGAFGAFPLFDGPGAAGGEGELFGVDGQGPDALFVVG